MEWMAIIGDSIQYIEEHITEEISVNSIAKHVNVSPFYFQKGFAMLCGFTVAEYIRHRRLALAGNDLLATDEKIIDIALKEYEFAAGYCVEYYDDPAKYEKGTLDENYYCEIWIPVKRK